MEELKNFLENEAEIVQKAKTDQAAFEVLYNHYFPKIYGFVFKRLGNKEDTQDLVSQVFFKAFVNLGQYQAKGYGFGSWLYKIATNSLCDFYRKKTRNKELPVENLPEIAASFDMSQAADLILQKQEINALFEKLPVKYREILYLRFFAEMSYEEAAGVLKINVNNARVLNFRALKYFYKIYDKYHKKDV